MTSELPWVTIVTPAYNQAEYLAATIESVLGQDYPNLEYIVIDDGSTDDSLAVARRYEARGVRVLTQANSGQAATLNRGWAASRGAFLGYLSSDDILHPQAISRLVAALLANPQAVVSYADFELIEASGRVIKQIQAEDYDAHRLSVDLVCQPGVGALFLRTAFDATGGWRPNLRQVPDFEFWLRLSRFGTFVRVKECLGQYRVHEKSASFSVLSVERCREIIDVADDYWRHAAPHPAKEKNMRRARARAQIISARHLAQSGRMKSALASVLSAVLARPSLALSWATWRVLLGGAMRRTVYGLLGRAT